MNNLISNFFRKKSVDLYALVPFNMAEGDFSLWSQNYILQEGTAIISLVGILNNDLPFYGSSYCDMKRLIVKANKDDEVNNILLKVDSPGGAVAGLQNLVTAIQSSKKEINAYVVGSCLSAAYWVASSCKKITASAGSVVGSVGAMIVTSKTDKDQEESVTSKFTERKNADISVDATQYQDLVDFEAGRFMKHVAKVRDFGKMSLEEIAAKTGNGKIMHCQEALTSGLIDALEQENIFNSAMKEDTMKEKESVAEAQSASTVTSADALKKIQLETEAMTLLKERERVLQIAKLCGIGDDVVKAIVNGNTAGEFAIAKLEAQKNEVKKTPANVVADDAAEINALNIPSSEISTEEKPVDIKKFAAEVAEIKKYL